MKHELTGHLVAIAELVVKQDKLDAFLDYTVENLKVSRASPGNIAFDILFDEANPTRIRFYEVWESAAAQQAYMAWRVQVGDLTKLISFLAETPKFASLRRVSSPRG